MIVFKAIKFVAGVLLLCFAGYIIVTECSIIGIAALMVVAGHVLTAH